MNVDLGKWTLIFPFYYNAHNQNNLYSILSNPNAQSIHLMDTTTPLVLSNASNANQAADVTPCKIWIMGREW